MSELLGEVVAWDLGATEVKYQAVQDALTSAGLDPESAAEMTAKSAFGRACKYLKNERRIDKVETEKGKIKFQLTKTSLEDGKLEFEYETFIYLDSETGDITCDVQELADKARELFAFARQTRTNSDITRLVQRMFREHADLYAISPKGVAYFVPACHSGFVQQVDDFMVAMGGKLCRFPVPSGTPAGNLSVKEAVQNGLGELLAELESAADGWDDKTRQATMNRAIERWEVIKHKTEAYGEYLGSEQERLLEGVATAKAKLAARIAELRPAEDTADTQAA
jgi:hypothetical protein